MKRIWVALLWFFVFLGLLPLIGGMVIALTAVAKAIAAAGDSHENARQLGTAAGEWLAAHLDLLAPVLGAIVVVSGLASVIGTAFGWLPGTAGRSALPGDD